MASVTPLEYALVAAAAFASAILGGMAGYGTGSLLPLALVPIIGAEMTVPVIGVASIFFNTSRLVAFRHLFDRRTALLIAPGAIPACLLGAYGYTKLGGGGAALWIGLALMLLVPGRRLLMRMHGKLSPGAVAAAGAGYGLLDGATPGTGVVLIALLMTAGLPGASVIATDAGISILLGIAKSGLFQAAGALPPEAWVMALLVGVMAMPGAFVARWLVAKLSARVHAGLLDAAIVAGGLVLVFRGLRG